MLLIVPFKGPPLLLGQISDVFILYKIVKCYLIVPLKGVHTSFEVTFSLQKWVGGHYRMHKKIANIMTSV